MPGQTHAPTQRHGSATLTNRNLAVKTQPVAKDRNVGHNDRTAPGVGRGFRVVPRHFPPDPLLGLWKDWGRVSEIPRAVIDAILEHRGALLEQQRVWSEYCAACGMQDQTKASELEKKRETLRLEVDRTGVAMFAEIRKPW